MIYSELAQEAEARAHMKEVLTIEPEFNLEDRRKQSPFKDPVDNERELDALRKAGAPEHPPSQ